ncbi:hypothetical protein ACLF6K_37385 [Streptomyces xanthophaeus]|uniref:hypothetical protein n=1 Tax=Streptomyces xanthophaeus TaxID=67385 RepID=UPI0039903A2B
MEVLIAACLLAWAAGAQSEQAKLGVSPAQRALIRERVRHENAVRKIAEKHGATPADPASTPQPEGVPATADPLTVPEGFRAGYRGHTPVARVATPAGRHIGNWAARGVYWTKDTGRGALREYRRRRQAAGHSDPAPVIAPPRPTHPPMPAQPPNAGGSRQAGVTLTKPGEDPADPQAATAPGGTATDPAVVPTPRTPQMPQDPPEGADTTTPAPTREGAGRMAAEVTYDSVADESDELSLMCEDDVQVYNRIRERCEREIGRADLLIAQLDDVGAGSAVISWVVRCKEQYQAIQNQLDELEQNTIAQGDAVVKARSLLEDGQGLYAGIAADMETVAERDFYTSDAVDSEDLAAHSDSYEMQGARS